MREVEECRKLGPDPEVASGLEVFVNHIEALKKEAAEENAGAEEEKAVE